MLPVFSTSQRDRIINNYFFELLNLLKYIRPLKKASPKEFWLFKFLPNQAKTMSRTILNPEYANDLNGLFNGGGEIDTGSISAGTITVGTGNNVCSIQSTAFNTLAIGGANSGDFVCGDINASGITSSLSFTVGSGNNVCGISSPALNTLGIGASSGGTLVCNVITLNGGTISVNSANQLCWNGLPIS